MPIVSQGFGMSAPELTASPTQATTPEYERCVTGPDATATASDAPQQCVQLSWQMVPFELDPNDFTFSVQRAESPGFRDEEDFEVLTEGKIGITSYLDAEVSFEDHYRTWYYRVVATSIATGQEFIGPVVRLNARPSHDRDLILREIRYRTAVLLERYTGTPCAYFPVRTFGAPCNHCRDEIMGRPSDSQCTSCFRTQIQGGYYLPIPRFIQFSPAPKRVDLEIYGKEHRTFCSAIMEHDPIARPGDLIKDLETGQVWDVAAVEPPTTKLGSIAHQNLVLYQLDRGEVEWQVAGSVDIENLCPLEWHAVLG